MTDKDKNHEADKHAAAPKAAPKADIPQPSLTGSLPPEAYMTEQEKAAIAGAAPPPEADSTKKKETR